jgi:hypothetical protein
MISSDSRNTADPMATQLADQLGGEVAAGMIGVR